jgi:hypothetical protein
MIWRVYKHGKPLLVVELGDMRPIQAFLAITRIVGEHVLMYDYYSVYRDDVSL